MALFRSHQQLL